MSAARPAPARRADGPPRLSALLVYPLKGAAGIPLHEAEIDAFGIRHDRRWLAVDAEGSFLSQRDHPRLALIRTTLLPGGLRLEAPGADPLTVEIPSAAMPAATPRTVTIWGDVVRARSAGPDARRWISAALELDAELVHLPDDAFRPVHSSYAVGRDRVSFADAFPFLLIGESSLDALNVRLPAPVPMNRFRPNLVVAGTPPHAEDGWALIRAGGIDLHVVKPCARCVVTTVDQSTAEKGREPLRALAHYRRWQGQVYFGQNLIHGCEGRLRVGDPVEVLERRDAPAPPLPPPEVIPPSPRPPSRPA